MVFGITEITKGLDYKLGLTQNPNSGFYIGATGAGNSTFGLYADENYFSAAEREFEQALSVGQSFQITRSHC